MRSLRHRRTRLARAWPLFVLVTLLVPPHLRADSAIVPLHELIGGSSSVFLGTVVSAEPAQGSPGSWILDITVEQTILGAELLRFTLNASTVDPTLPAVQQKGTQMIVFVPAVQRTITEGDVVPLPADHPPDPGIEMIRSVAAQGTKLLLPAVQTFLENGAMLPPELLGSLLQTLREAGPGGGPHVEALLEIGCTSPSTYRMESQLFALEELGDAQAGAARPCLEATALDPKNLSRRIAAVEALGNLAAPASVAPLVSLLPYIEQGPLFSQRGDENDPRFGFGPLDDPEREERVPPDPGEGRDPGEPDDAENDDGGIPRDADGERELDFAPSDDASLGDDGGLANAAVLALGKIGSPDAIPDLFRVARGGDDLALHSSVVVALGMIGSEGWPAKVNGPLTAISKTHPNELVRALAMQTLARLASARR